MSESGDNNDETLISKGQWRKYISKGYTGGCPSCSSEATSRLKHMTRFHKISKDSIMEEGGSKTCYYHNRNCPLSNLSRCQRRATEEYKLRANERLARATKRLKENIEKSKTGTRIHEDSTWMSKCMSELEVGEPITTRNYVKGDCKDGTNRFVICSPDEAKRILEVGPPRLPILILPKPKDSDGIRKRKLYCHQLIREIKSGPALHVFDYSEAASNRNPELRSAEETIQEYKGGKGTVFNILNIPMRPGEDDWLGQIQGFNFIQRICKMADDRGLDISKLLSATKVMLMATSDALSLEHVDKHAFITRIKLWSGYKFWNVACNRSTGVLEEVTKSGKYSGERFTILLEEGCELIQPAGLLHSVLTHEDNALTSCFMYWHPMMIQQVLDQTLLEIRNPSITNDEHISTFVDTMEIAFEILFDEAGTWLDTDEICEAHNTFDVIKKELNLAETCARSSTRVGPSSRKRKKRA